MQTIESHVEDRAASDSIHLTIDQAAVAAGVSTKTIRRMISGGFLHPARQGEGNNAPYLIDRADLDVGLQRWESEPKSPSSAMLPVISGPAGAEEFVRMLSEALTQSHTARIADQAETIGAQRERIANLEARLAAATAPKAARAISPRIRRPRASVPLDDPLMAGAVLARRFDGAALNTLIQTLAAAQAGQQ